MRSTVALLAMLALALACSSSEDEPISPKPDTSSSTAVVTSSSSGQGGAGGTSVTTSTGTGTGGTGGDGAGGAGGDDDLNRQGFYSGSRLRARYYDGSDGSRTYVGFYDQLLAVNCTVLETTDAKRRCVPEAPGTTEYFSDAACTMSVVAFHKSSCPSPPSGYVRAFVVGLCGNPGQVRVLQVGAPYAGTVYFPINGTCTALALSPTDYWINSATLVSPSTWVEMTEGIE